MKLTPVQMYQNSREEITPTGRATERLIHHPYGNLSERYERWTQSDTQALRAMRNRNNEEADTRAVFDCPLSVC